MFLDEAVVEFQSGDGGSGAVSFHREKHVPRGGPNGADGGRGGDIILQAERGMRTLYEFRLKSKFKADNGEHAHGNKRGKGAKDIVVKVPVGTVVTDTVLNEVLADMNVHGMTYTICKGGRGGFGNLHYVSSVRQVPNFAQKGAPGDRIVAKLELKLLADVGLIGLPNAGKSTLLATISAAKPKVGDYPFTTVVPNLGVARAGEDTFVVADMPGLIAGASQGHGLGLQFLKHIDRTKVLVHVVEVRPVDESDPIANYALIEKELAEYSPDVAARPRIIALSKCDLSDSGSIEVLREQFSQLAPTIAISSATGFGIEELLFLVHSLLEAVASKPAVPVVIPPLERAIDNEWSVSEVDDGFEVVGRRVLRMVAMTDLQNRDAVRYLHKRLDRLGVIEELRKAGAEEGDTVYIGDRVFAFTDFS